MFYTEECRRRGKWAVFFRASFLEGVFKLIIFPQTADKLFVIKQSKWCKFMTKMHQNTFGSLALGELMRPLAAMGAYF